MTYYWILAVEPTTGRPVVLGPYDTEAAANDMAFSKLGAAFEVVPLQTRDVRSATKILKHRRFEQSEQLAEVLKRARHKV